MKSATSDTANTLPLNAKPLQLTPAERSALRARAHALNPVVMVGNAGLTDSVLLEAPVQQIGKVLVIYRPR